MTENQQQEAKAEAYFNEVLKYTYIIKWSEKSEAFIGLVKEMPFVSAHGDTPEEALRSIVDAVEFSQKLATDKGWTIKEPLSFQEVFTANLGETIECCGGQC